MSSYNEDHYRMGKDGFETKAEYERAIANGDIEQLSNGRGWDRQTGKEYWSDGSEK